MGAVPEARIAARRLGTFTVADLADALGVSRKHANVRALEMLDAGICRLADKRRTSSVQGRYSHVYEWVRPPASPPGSYPVQPPPELEVVEQYAKQHRPARGRPVNGTGRKRKLSSNSELNALIGDLEALGAEIKKARGKHIDVYWCGIRAYSLPCSPSDHRAVLNCRAELRRLGIPVP